jgi:hypothetical protein
VLSAAGRYQKPMELRLELAMHRRWWSAGVLGLCCWSQALPGFQRAHYDNSQSQAAGVSAIGPWTTDIFVEAVYANLEQSEK